MSPSAPRRRNSAAQCAEAIPPPISRCSTRCGTVRAEEDLQLLLEPRVEHGQDLVAGLEHRVGRRHESALALAQDRDQQAALGHVEVADPHPGDAAVVGEQHLDDLEALLGQIEQVHEPVLRHLVLQQPQDQVRRGDVGLDPEQLEVRAVPGVVDSGDDPVDEVLLLRDLADQHVVLVIAGHRDHHVGAGDSRSLQDPELGGVPVLDVVLELLLDRGVAIAVVLDHGHLMTLVEQLPREVPADLAGPGDDDVLALAHRLVPAASRTSFSNISIATRVGQIVLTPCFSYHSARSGSRIRAITMFVLSPSVEAMKASARSIPAAVSASSSSPVPTVNWPPASSQDLSRLTSSRACASGSSSTHETSCPSRSMVRATVEPTLPQPTIRTNIRLGS